MWDADTHTSHTSIRPHHAGHTECEPILPYRKAYGDLRCAKFHYNTTMWANAQRDGRSDEYRWRPVLNSAKFGSRPLLDYRAVTLRIGERKTWKTQSEFCT